MDHQGGVFFLKTTFLGLPVHPHPSYPFLKLQRSQRSLCWYSKLLSHPSPALCSLLQLGERETTSFRDSFSWECYKTGASGQFFPLAFPPLFYFIIFKKYFFTPNSQATFFLPEYVFHMFPISHTPSLPNLLPAPQAGAINLLGKQNSRQRS